MKWLQEKTSELRVREKTVMTKWPEYTGTLDITLAFPFPIVGSESTVQQ